MLTRDLIGQVRRLEIKTRRLVNDVFSGAYSSVFRGLGMEFAEVREYVPGDDVRTIDWNVTARMNHPYVKKFMAEREMTVMLMIDTSASMRFGTALKWKSELAAELAAVLSFSAILNNDKVGMCLFSDQVEQFVRPQKGRTHTLRLIRDILEYTPKRRSTNLPEALRTLNRVIKRKAVVFLMSDFLFPKLGAATRMLPGVSSVDEKLLAITAKRHDLVALQIADPLENQMPSKGLIEWRDAETGEATLVDTSSAAVRARFESLGRERQKRLESIFRRHAIDHIPLTTDRPFVGPLIQFFHARAKRFR